MFNPSVTYNSLNELNEKSKEKLKVESEQVIASLKNGDYPKYQNFNKDIPTGLKITYESKQHMIDKRTEKRKKEEDNAAKGIRKKVVTTHPISPIRGQIYNALLGENWGSELSGEHPVLIISNAKNNLFAQKVNVVAIEGDGNNTSAPYLVQISSSDFEDGAKKLKKDPSRVVAPEILTIDKSRLNLLVGKLKDKKMLEISEALAKQLEIPLGK